MQTKRIAGKKGEIRKFLSIDPYKKKAMRERGGREGKRRRGSKIKCIIY
jgi:hypothetical protein